MSLITLTKVYNSTRARARYPTLTSWVRMGWIDVNSLLHRQFTNKSRCRQNNRIIWTLIPHLKVHKDCLWIGRATMLLVLQQMSHELIYRKSTRTSSASTIERCKSSAETVTVPYSRRKNRLNWRWLKQSKSPSLWWQTKSESYSISVNSSQYFPAQ